jgi:hypothetical protein
VADYPGQQKEASHEGFSSQLTKPLKEWLPTLGAFRERWLPDNRRMSFEKLSEPARWRALPAFLGGPGELNILRKADAAFAKRSATPVSTTRSGKDVTAECPAARVGDRGTVLL